MTCNQFFPVLTHIGTFIKPYPNLFHPSSCDPLQEEDCQSGCTIRHFNPSLSLQHCTDTCVSTCICYSDLEILIAWIIIQCVSSNLGICIHVCLLAQGGTLSCEDGCRITVESPVMPLPPPPTSPPLVNPSPLEGVYTVSIPRPNTTDPLSSSDDQVEEVFLVQVEDQLGNETYFTMVSVYSLWS